MSQTPATAFAQPPAGSPGARVAGFAFGLVCIAVALVIIATVAVVALARVARRRAPSPLAWTRAAAQRRASLPPARPHSSAMLAA